MRPRVMLIAVVVLFALAAAGFQQDRASHLNHQSYNDRQAKMLGLIRTINTLEAGDYSRTGSYETWPVLMERHSDDLNGWLARNGLVQANRFASLPEIVPGWKLRLDVNADGHRGYFVLMEDIHDRQGFAYVSDERGIIREGRYTN